MLAFLFLFLIFERRRERSSSLFETPPLVELRRAWKESKSRFLSSEWVVIMNPAALIDLKILQSS